MSPVATRQGPCPACGRVVALHKSARTVFHKVAPAGGGGPLTPAQLVAGRAPCPGGVVPLEQRRLTKYGAWVGARRGGA